MKGKVIKYFSFRGFGFINPEGSSEEIFFHVSNYPGPQRITKGLGIVLQNPGDQKDLQGTG